MTRTGYSEYLDENRDRFNAELLDLLRIPSISTSPDHAQNVRKAADWVRLRLRNAGFPFVEMIETKGHPVVFGRWKVSPELPTLLVYGHYDVQPVEPLELWESPPFIPTERGERIYARGSADMKANLTSFIHAVEALGKTGGSLPVNLLVLFEGEEEIGSPNLPQVVADRKDQLAADSVLSADGGMFGFNQPSLTVGLKGLAGCQVNVRTSSTDLHSGSYGAAVPNAVQVLTNIAASIHRADNSVAIAGFYDDVLPLTDAEKTALDMIPYDDDGFMKEAGVDTLWGESGYSVLERRWTRPTADFNGIWGGYQGLGAKTVTPSQASLKITCRLVADQQPETILDLIERHVALNTPAGVKVSVERMPGSAFPYRLDLETPALASAQRALRSVYGTEPFLVRSGGTVPVTEVFQRELGANTITIGFGMPGSRAHAPNEWFRTEDLPISRSVYAQFLQELGSDS
jgi:acetylornithine deacetylase/succinyl-diaminopimelate desuccinylase-like protein